MDGRFDRECVEALAQLNEPRRTTALLRRIDGTLMLVPLITLPAVLHAAAAGPKPLVEFKPL